VTVERFPVFRPSADLRFFDESFRVFRPSADMFLTFRFFPPVRGCRGKFPRLCVLNRGNLNGPAQN
jgi:hypothetical protein